MFTEFDGLIEPSRNHRAYRIAVGKLQPPILPFMPLLLKGTLNFRYLFKPYFQLSLCVFKDMTFTHEGNRTLLDSAGLINFEKMHMLAQTMRTLRYCRSRQLRNFIFFNKLIWAVQRSPILNRCRYLFFSIIQCCNRQRRVVSRKFATTFATWGSSIISASLPGSRSDSSRNGPKFQTHITTQPTMLPESPHWILVVQLII